MKYDEVMKKLEELGTEQSRKIYKRHGADIDMFGVSIANLKKVLKFIKKDVDLGYKLLKSKNIDAIYMSQWMIDSSKLTILDLEELLDLTTYYMILDNVIPNLALKNKALTYEVLSLWLSHNNSYKRQSAYSLYSYVLGTYPVDEINVTEVQNILKHIKSNIHSEANRVKYSMNSFVISAGIYVPELTEYAIEVGQSIGKVYVSMGETACKVPFSPDYIQKVKVMNRIGKKR